MVSTGRNSLPPHLSSEDQPLLKGSRLERHCEGPCCDIYGNPNGNSWDDHNILPWVESAAHSCATSSNGARPRRLQHGYGRSLEVTDPCVPWENFNRRPLHAESIRQCGSLSYQQIVVGLGKSYTVSILGPSIIVAASRERLVLRHRKEADNSKAELSNQDKRESIVSPRIRQ